MTFFQHFLETLPPDPNVRPLDASSLEGLRARALPPELLTFYEEIGTGSFGGGVLFVSTPDHLQDMLDLWLNRSARRIPFARTAFGEIFYYRDLRVEAEAMGMSGENPGELEDVSWVDVHYGRIEVVALSLVEFFEEILGNPDNVETMLRAPMVRSATEILGALNPDEVYGFVPALGLGGSEDITSVQRVHGLVHSSILRQLL